GGPFGEHDVTVGCEMVDRERERLRHVEEALDRRDRRILAHRGLHPHVVVHGLIVEQALDGVEVLPGERGAELTDDITGRGHGGLLSKAEGVARAGTGDRTRSRRYPARARPATTEKTPWQRARTT